VYADTAEPSSGLHNAYAVGFRRKATSRTEETTGVIISATELTVGGLLVLAMIAVSVRGWLTLPSDARVPIRHGLRGYGNYLSKTAGLITWPAAGIIIYGLYVGVFAEDLATHYRTGLPLLFLPAVLVVLITVQMGAIRAAGKSSGPDLVG